MDDLPQDPKIAGLLELIHRGGFSVNKLEI
jgi:hypothetical protein